MPSPSEKNPLRTPTARWAAWSLACATLIAAAGSIGGTTDPVTALILTIDTHARAGWPAIVLLIAALGYGRLCARIGPRFLDISRVSPAIGLAVSLLLIVLLGTAGMLNGLVIGAAAIAGVSVFVADVIQNTRAAGRAGRPLIAPPPAWLWAGLPGIALLAVAAASPPGVLWASEYAGYDTLSYHLQLPKEWVALGHTRPVVHNVYSFLPGAVEQAYAAIATLRGAVTGVADPLDDGGAALSAAHTFHAGLTILAGGMVARLSRRLATAAGLRSRAVAIAAAFAGGVVLCTPWTVVVGSLAYNEMGVVLIGAGAMLISCRRGPRRAPISVLRAAVVGGMVAAACLVKPTALLFVGAPAGILLLRFGRLRQWPAMVAAGSAIGAVVLAVWLVRNTIMTGNPVFPLATGVFGTGHWSVAQAERFASAHAFDGSFADRLRLLVFADPSVAEGANAVARYRGISNTQWLLAFPGAAAGVAALLVVRRSRDIGIGVGLCLLAQIAAWLWFTHLQSRFLVPCLVVIGPAIGVGLGVWTRGVRSERVAIGLGSVLVLLQTSALWTVYAEQNAGEPNRALGVPPAVFMGDPYTPEIGRIDPIAYLNYETPADATVLLVGDATPLYYRRPTIYATVWDRPPILDLDTHQPDFVLINDAELARQRESGYLHEALTDEFIDAIVRTLRPARFWPELGIRLYRVPSQETP